MEVRDYVLVPGAWHGGWCWHPVAKRLRAAGHTAVCLTLPGLGDGDDPVGHRLADAVDHVVEQVRARELTNVVLVGHSWGGYVITGAAHQLADRLAEVVYYNGIVPIAGVSLIEELPPENAALLRAAIEASPDGAISPEFEWTTVLMHDAPEPAQRLLYELLTPQPGSYFLDALDVGPVTELGLATRYVLSENDQVLSPPGAEFAARLGQPPTSVPGTHESLLTHPAELAAALLT
ncbi:alpha/beta fold hydrolase [Pseudonocardia spinosispora]|uniref:alpha/beta fold hydrolase n=1 Tax=Pseudonocardia spinosispora TaxID=103441 RepID=UPI001B7FA109|nr:alpha/beta hydrolase [Pseudonocardia spinosispora]